MRGRRGGGRIVEGEIGQIGGRRRTGGGLRRADRELLFLAVAKHRDRGVGAPGQEKRGVENVLGRVDRDLADAKQEVALAQPGLRGGFVG